MMRGPIVPQPSVTLVRIVIVGVRTILHGVLRQDSPKHLIVPWSYGRPRSLADDVPPTA